MKNLFNQPRQKIYNFSFIDPIKFLFKKNIREKELSYFFKEKFNFKKTLTLSHGRLGIYLAVRAIVAKDKNEIILSPYTIFDVVNMVVCAGGKPVFADIEIPSIEMSLNEVKKSVNDNTAGVIVTHYHSYCKNISEIRKITQEKKIKLIEDCAIAFGTRLDKETYVGSNSDIAIFSFNITKFISTLSSGLLVTNDEQLLLSMENFSKEFNVNPLVYLFKKYIKALQIKIFTSQIIFNLITKRIIVLTKSSKIKIFKNLVRTDPNPKILYKLPKYYKSYVTSYQRKEIYSKVSKYLEKDDQVIRLKNYQTYQEELSSIKEITIHKIKNDFSNGVVSFPLFYDYRDDLYKYMLNSGCDVSRYFYRDCSTLKIFQHLNYNCKKSLEACDKVILLPLYPSYKLANIKKNINFIKKFFNK